MSKTWSLVEELTKFANECIIDKNLKFMNNTPDVVLHSSKKYIMVLHTYYQPRSLLNFCGKKYAMIINFKGCIKNKRTKSYGWAQLFTFILKKRQFIETDIGTVVLAVYTDEID